MRYKSGDIIVREGDYGSSAFLILRGKARVVLGPELPPELLGRRITKKKKLWEAIGQLWTNRKVPEVRDTERYAKKNYRHSQDAEKMRVFLQDVPAILDKHRTAELTEGDVFGELAALGRIPRTASVFCDGDEAELLEIR